MRNNIKSIIYLFKPYWKYSKSMIIIMILIASICPSLATVGSIMYQQTIVTELTEGRELGYIFATATWISAIIFLPQIISSVFDTSIATIAFEKVEKKIKRDIYEKAKMTDYKYFDNPEFYDNYTWTINERVQKANEARSMIVSFFTITVTIASVIGLIVAQDWLIVVITVISLCIGLLIGFRTNKMGYKKHEENLRPYRTLSYINNIFYNRTWAADIKATNVSKKMMVMYDKAYDKIFSILRKYQHRFSLYKTLSFVLSFVVQILITVYLCYQVISGKILVGSFVGLIAASGVLKDRLAQLFGFIQNSNRLSYYAERLKKFEELDSPIENSTDGVSLDSSHACDITIKNVCFTYPKSSFGLKNINLEIKKGQKIAIVGENGGGKTTLTKLLLRLYDVDNGSILINGRNIKEYDIRDVRKCIGLAPQTPNIYALSLSENLSLYSDHLDTNGLEGLFHKFALDKIIEKADHNLDANMTREFDENGILLSGGEAQKLALARLNSKKFGLLILDEPSSALDPISEYELNELVFSKASEATTIMISHRLSNVRRADCIYLFSDGEIAEQGTHDELMEQKGKYYEMFTKQAEKYS